MVEASGRFQRIGRYTVLRELASGGMGKVFIAQRDGEPGICVLKRLHVEMELHHTAGLRFQREAQLAALLDHPNIARTNRSGIEDGRFTIEMEYIPGLTVSEAMRKLLEQGRLLPYELSTNVACGMLAALTHAHELRAEDGRHLGIVHRDLTPRNVMLSYQGEVKIIDFGIARGNVDDFRTAPGSIFGTMTYASPEQAMGQPVDARSDLYTVGCVLFEMLTGRPVVTATKFEEVLRSVTTETPPLISELNPDVPRGFEPVVRRALEKDPERRFQDARGFLHALEAAAGHYAEPVPELIGEFLRSQFPEREERTQTAYFLPKSMTRPEDGVPTIQGEGPDESSTLVRPQVADPEDMPSTHVGEMQRYAATAVVRRKRPRDLPELNLPTAYTVARPSPTVATHVAPAPAPAPKGLIALGTIALLGGLVVVGLLVSGGTGDPPPPPPPPGAPADAPLAASAGTPPPPPPPPPPPAKTAPPPPPPPPPPSPPSKAATKRRVKPPPPPPPPAPPKTSSRKTRVLRLMKRLEGGEADAFESLARELRAGAKELKATDRRKLLGEIEGAEVLSNPRALAAAANHYLDSAP